MTNAAADAVVVSFLLLSLQFKTASYDDIMKQMRGLYARANSVLRKFAACSFEVKLRLFQAFCTSFYCARLWYKFTKQVMSKVSVAYNNVFRLLFGYRRSCSTSEMFVTNDIYITLKVVCENILILLLCGLAAAVMS